MSGPDRGEEGDAGDRRSSDAADEGPPDEPPGVDGSAGADASDRPTTHATEDDPGPLEWFLTTNQGGVVIVRDIVSSVGTVALIGLVLFGVSGLWPPLVAVESGSMEPHMHRGDLVFIVDEQRFPPDGAVGQTGIVTYRQAAANDSHWSFGDYGNVIVYKPDGKAWKTPIIHRARFHVERGENWVDPPSEGGTGKADSEYLGGATTCAQVRTCPAPHDGFVTLGDANRQYDQVAGQSGVVRSEWIRGRAKVRIPYLGYIRLLFGGLQAGVSPDLLSRGVASLAGAVGVVGLRRAA